MSKWIDTKHQSPEPCNLYNVWCGDKESGRRLYLGYFVGDDNWISFGESEPITGVTHYSPMPKFPKRPQSNLFKKIERVIGRFLRRL